MDQLDRKQIISTVREHFSRPDAVYGIVNGVVGHDYCCYRGNDDPASLVRCAGGVLIPDSEYQPKMESMNVETLFVRFFPERLANDVFARIATPESVAVRIDTDYNPGFQASWISKLQGIHDHCARNGKPMRTFLDALDLYEEATTTTGATGASRGEA